MFAVNVPSILAQTFIHHGHSHNDYKQKQPLARAIQLAYKSIEVDVFYNKGRFNVAHTRVEIRKNRNLEQMYLVHLEKLLSQQADNLYAKEELELMIDTKGKWNTEQLIALHRLIEKYHSMFTYWENGGCIRGKVKVVLTGGDYLESIMQHQLKYFFADAGLHRLEYDAECVVLARISAKYNRVFQSGNSLSEQETEQLKKWCETANKANRKIRFWACPHDE
jgi:hypothetical protein